MIALEQSIIMILLLTGLLHARPRLSGLAKLGIAGALMLAFIAPHIFAGMPLWKGTLSDEMREHKDRTAHDLEHPDPPGDATATSPE